MTGIVDIQLEYLRRLLEARHIKLELDEKARIWLGDKGYDPAYGARPLKRVIQSNLQNKLAEMILKGETPDGSLVKVGVKGEVLEFKIASAGTAQKTVSDKPLKSVA